MQPLMIFSADGHIGQSGAGYRDYIDPEFRDRLDDLTANQNFLSSFFYGSLPPDVASVVDERGVRDGLPEVFWDVDKRLAELDAEGIAGELVLVDSALAPFIGGLGDAYPQELRAAGARAFNRWAAELLGASGGRIRGNAEVRFVANEDGFRDDIARCVESELPRLVEQGFVSVTVPGSDGESSVPLLDSRDYDPFWGACAELGVVLNIHAGWGREQGGAIAFFRKLNPAAATNMMQPGESDSPEKASDEMLASIMEKKDDPDTPFKHTVLPARALWRLMLGGVFDRFPNLKLVLTEVRADWVPATLAYLDRRFAEHAPKCELTPSEYFTRNIAITPASPHQVEVQMRDEIGIEQFLFGADIPHPESTWPNTKQWIGDAFPDVPEDQLRMILGENAVRFYELDRAPFDEAAARLAVERSDLFAGGALDERLLAHFDARAGYLKPKEELDEEKIAPDLDSDFARLVNT